ncbi:MAG: type I DNA topoisomerase [Patescibacteria group bacterium]|nr:type I DNA topoisomerase [Patescibacteria group bacterium]
MKLVIVESPTKAKTIGQFLKSGYKVESSYGHIRDLPKSSLGIDTENNFEPKYVVPRKNQKTVTALKKEAAKAEKVILASDEDREGEAISWHLIHALKLDDKEKDGKVERITFHEITKPAIEAALEHPRGINMNLVNAQQARRVLDRLVGYKLSPFLWKKVMGKLSAGRVQSAALKLIAEREEEIKKFNPEEYWTVTAILNPQSSEKDVFASLLNSVDGKTLEKMELKAAEAEKISEDLKKSEFKVESVERKELKRNPLPPFTTSTLQQEASRRLRFSARQTMRVAQSLYEKGLITYMRTDSVNLAPEALSAAKEWIMRNLGEKYASSSPRRFKVKSRLAQEAHEAIRPTDISLESPVDDPRERKLYDLIWRRFVASQLPQAIFDSKNIAVSAEGKRKYGLRSSGSTLKFDGFLKIWPTKFEENNLPEVKAGEALRLKEVKPEQHFTEPPARYNDASLIKALEEYGIGRPSTYAPIISLLQERNYVVKNQDRRFEPTEIGGIINKVLSENFPEIVDIGFTAKMEEDLDKVAEGEADWKKIIGAFYSEFEPQLEKKYVEVESMKPPVIETDEKCELCGKPMVIKFGRFGKFLACSGFPECKNTKSLQNEDNNTNIPCPKCGEGRVVVKKTRKGRIFYGCNRWPNCDYASWKKPEQQTTSKL